MLVDDIALTLYPGVGSRTAIHLIACFGSAERLFAATADEIVERAELRPDLAQRISRREYHERAAKEVDSIRRNGSGLSIRCRPTTRSGFGSVLTIRMCSMSAGISI